MAGIELFFGPLLIGVFLNTILYGVLLVQMFIYYQSFKREASWIRYFVLYLFIVETLNTCFDIMLIYEPLITRYATTRALTIAPMMLKADGVVTVAISTPVQIFIAWRIKIISQSTLLTALISFFAICSFVGGVATTVAVSVAPEFARFQEFEWTIITWLVGSAVADVFITGSLVWSLYNRKTGVAGSDDIINKIMRLSIQTGAITTIAAITDIILWRLLPHTTLNFIPDFPLSKLYTNSLLSTFNARGGWKNHAGQGGHNVLFGYQKESGVSVSRLTNLPHSPKNPTGSAYEPPPRSTSLGEGAMKSPPDLEFGISMVTKIETFNDSVPRSN